MNANTKGGALLTIFSIFFVFLIILFPVDKVFGQVDYGTLLRAAEYYSKTGGTTTVQDACEHVGYKYGGLGCNEVSDFLGRASASKRDRNSAASKLYKVIEKVIEKDEKIPDDLIDKNCEERGFNYNDCEFLKERAGAAAKQWAKVCAIRKTDWKESCILAKNVLASNILRTEDAAEAARMYNRSTFFGGLEDTSRGVGKYSFIVLNKQSSTPLGGIATTTTNTLDDNNPVDTISISGLYNLAIYIGSGLAILYIALGGINIAVFGRDSSANKASGKSMIIDAILGLLVLLFAYMILNTINPDILEPNTILSSFLMRYG